MSPSLPSPPQQLPHTRLLSSHLNPNQLSSPSPLLPHTQTLNPAYFPIKLNSSGMMPIIIAGAVYYGATPMLMKYIGMPAAAAALTSWQGTIYGLLTYGLIVSHTCDDWTIAHRCRVVA